MKIILLFLTFVSSALYSANVHFEEATPDQAEYLTQLAMDANATYKYRTVPDEVAIESFKVNEEIFRDGVVKVMMLDDEIIGFYGLMEKGLEQKVHLLTHLFLKSEYIGKGYGRTLFNNAMETASKDFKWETLIWQSDPNAAWFYKKMGAKQIGDSHNRLNPAMRAPVFIYVLGNDHA